MRIVIDMQGAQSTDSRNRGIGRYTLSLVQGIIRNRGEHEIILVLNGLFPDAIETIRTVFSPFLPQKNIQVWHAPDPVDYVYNDNCWRRQTAELAYESFISNLRPSVVVISSLFEGYGDNAVTSIGLLNKSVPTASILYDLIPLINPDQYLTDPIKAKWYEEKLQYLRCADLLLSISESSRLEAIRYLEFAPEKIVNISTAADKNFQVVPIDLDQKTVLMRKYGINRHFLMYTGGIDYRKNIEGLIRAYASLPTSLRQMHQLAIVCSIQKYDRLRLETLAKKHGLAVGELVLTGFVSDDDLVTLYNLCKAFVFPSKHEGFGLPALEAMACGRAVIGSNTSSLPEVIGYVDALFDPYDDASIAAKIQQVLTDELFRQGLELHSSVQVQQFSWNKTAIHAIRALENLVTEDATLNIHKPSPSPRPRLAYISPLPPQHSGIADYSAELIPELTQHYEIEVVVAQKVVTTPWITANCPVRTVEWFRENIDKFDRVFYHFGNSEYHEHMLELLQQIPGVVVLHDFFMSGLYSYHEYIGSVQHALTNELYAAHGYPAVYERFHAGDERGLVVSFPCNYSVLQQSIGVIVHSEYPKHLAFKWYGEGVADEWAVIPLLRAQQSISQGSAVRQKLMLGSDDFLVCSFGMIGPTKQNHKLLAAWLNSALAQDKRCKLVFVGEKQLGTYCSELQRTIKKSDCKERISILGWTDHQTFQQYLSVADIAVQLRTNSRGETSAAVLDCMNHALPTIVNSNGSMAELPIDAVWLLEDDFKDQQLVEALNTLWRDKERRLSLGKRAQEYILSHHDPRACAAQYMLAIEGFYRTNQSGMKTLTTAIAQLDDTPNKSDKELMSLAAALAYNTPRMQGIQQLLVDISDLVQQETKPDMKQARCRILAGLLHNPPHGYRVEPVYAIETGGYCYARNFTFDFLDCGDYRLPDDPIEVQNGDIFFGLDFVPRAVAAQVEYLLFLHRQGVQVQFLVQDLSPILLPQQFSQDMVVGYKNWLETVIKFDGAICLSSEDAGALEAWIKEDGNIKRSPTFQVNWFPHNEVSENSTSINSLHKIFSKVR